MKKLAISLFVLGFSLYCALPCFGMAYPAPTPTPPFNTTLVAKAPVDECFNGIGGDYIAGSSCSSNQKPKTNQSYVWGLTKAGDNLWFGTAANMLCLIRAYDAYENGLEASPYWNGLWTCEFDEGQYVKTQMPSVTVPSIFSDYRPPKIYTYNITTKVLTDKTLEITNPQAQLLLQATFGLRSAVTFGNYVFLSGPMALGAGINLFAFNATTGAFLGAATLKDFQNIRRWLVLNNVLYAAVGAEGGGGKILRWTGTAAAPFTFAEVGVVDGAASEIVAHDGRIFVGTWPSRINGVANMAGLWMSPVVPATGLTAADAASWQKVWQADRYEPDALNASLYGMGAMASYGGYLYFGTMHVQGKAARVFAKQYNITGNDALWETYNNSWRSAAIFRGSNLTATTPTFELLYGNATLPVYVYSNGRGYWTSARNRMGGVSGRYGTSGFGNKYNNYCWSMAIYNSQLFVGTMDHGYLWLDWEHLQGVYDGEPFYSYIPYWYDRDPEEWGADLWRFTSTSSAASRVSRDGLGNYTNMGFRNMIADEATGLYVGTANPANLYREDGDRGGWELLRVTKR
ncbi:MAG: hypothetical protein HY911_02025 [Desulfobacterales bacterium]|nr:hypothetical protein [Desulfobacterales bacterium]